MNYKILFIFLLILDYSYASFQELRIGKIDDYYKNKISKYELRKIIDEVEYKLESQLNTNVFDYSENGKSINLVYVPPSKLEKQIDRQIKRIKTKEKKIQKLKSYFPKNDKEIEKSKATFEKRNKIHSQEIKKFNSYVRNINKKKSLSTSEYKKEKAYIQKEKIRIDKETKILKKNRKAVQKSINKYNQELIAFNSLIKEYNRLNNELERMNRGFKKVKGMTFGQKEIRLKTFYKNGKKVQEKSISNSMNKIEIYGFDSLDELKAIIAHEILHLVGLPHINSKHSLMHPTLQKRQIEDINLTYDDIANFNKHF